MIFVPERISNAINSDDLTIVFQTRLLLNQFLRIVNLILIIAVDHGQIVTWVQLAGGVEYIVEYRQSSPEFKSSITLNRTVGKLHHLHYRHGQQYCQ